MEGQTTTQKKKTANNPSATSTITERTAVGSSFELSSSKSKNDDAAVLSSNHVEGVNYINNEPSIRQDSTMIKLPTIAGS